MKCKVGTRGSKEVSVVGCSHCVVEGGGVSEGGGGMEDMRWHRRMKFKIH